MCSKFRQIFGEILEKCSGKSVKFWVDFCETIEDGY